MTTKKLPDTKDVLPSPFAITAPPFGELPQLVTLPSANVSLGSLEGRIIDQRYDLVRRLGYGGMGTVYLAKHLGLGIDVAVKVLHEALAIGEEHKRRFWREAHAASSLTHPNIVRVLDFGSDEVITYLVMEYLEGRSLGQFIDDNDQLMPLTLVCTLCEQFLDGLGAAHERGIVHRDLKPDNVFLVSEISGVLVNDPNAKLVVKILDFGLAHIEVPIDPATLTLTSHVAGTPAYMSPEQCRSLAVGPSTDLYAFGCMLTELLQGTPPFASNAPVDMMAKHLFAPPPELSRPVGAEPVPALLEALRRELLAKDPAHRPGTAAEVKERIQIAFDPERAKAQMPERSQPVHRAREDRAPRWTDPAPAAPRDADATSPSVVVNVIDVSLDEAQLLTMRAVGLSPVLEGNAHGVVLLGAASAQPFEERILAHKHKGPVLCLTKPTPDGLRSLIAAGAADVVAFDAGFEAVTRKLLRLARRRR